MQAPELFPFDRQGFTVHGSRRRLLSLDFWVVPPMRPPRRTPGY
jgi:hypothetical protein